MNKAKVNTPINKFSFITYCSFLNPLQHAINLALFLALTSFSNETERCIFENRDKNACKHILYLGKYFKKSIKISRW